MTTKKPFLRIRGSFLSVLIVIQGLLLTMSLIFTAILLDSLSKSDQEKTERIGNYVQNEIKQDTAIPSLAALSIASNEALAKAFAEKNRPKLKELSDEIWKRLEPQGLSQFSFFLPIEAGIIAFYKAHQPEVFGDLISKSRIMVQRCNEEKNLIAGLEQGKSGYGFRAVTPIYYKEKYLGCVEFGSKFAEGFLSNLNDFQAGKWSIVNLDQSVKASAGELIAVSTLNLTKEEASIQAKALSPAILDSIKASRSHYEKNKSAETVSLFIPIKNFNNEVTLYIKNEFKTDYFQKMRNILWTSIGVCLFGLLLSGGIIFLLYRGITIPISGLVRETEKIKNFQLDETVSIPAHLKEIENLVSAVSNMKTGLVSFQKYVPSQLVRQLIHTGQEAKISGQKKELTVLFSDIADFTTISEQLSPTELTEQLSFYLNAVTNIIIEESGTVDKYIGDAVMAFWGAPVELEDHAVKACRAALRAQKKIMELADSWRTQGRPMFKTRIGINTGDLIVGNIGSDQRLSYTVIGDTVNLASRIEGINKNYKTNILITDSTYQLCKDHFEVRAMDYVVVKGKTKAVKVYELIAEKASATETTRDYNFKFSSAVELFHQGKVTEAKAIFSQLSTLNSQDFAAKWYLEREYTSGSLKKSA